MRFEHRNFSHANRDGSDGPFLDPIYSGASQIAPSSKDVLADAAPGAHVPTGRYRRNAEVPVVLLARAAALTCGARRPTGALLGTIRRTRSPMGGGAAVTTPIARFCRVRTMGRL